MYPNRNNIIGKNEKKIIVSILPIYLEDTSEITITENTKKNKIYCILEYK